MAEPAKSTGAGGFILLIVVIAIAIGWITAMMNANTPLAKQRRALRAAEAHAEALCRRAGCPDECRRAGMC